jgi:hypothetical protein
VSPRDPVSAPTATRGSGNTARQRLLLKRRQVECSSRDRRGSRPPFGQLLPPAPVGRTTAGYALLRSFHPGRSAPLRRASFHRAAAGRAGGRAAEQREKTGSTSASETPSGAPGSMETEVGMHFPSSSPASSSSSSSVVPTLSAASSSSTVHSQSSTAAALFVWLAHRIHVTSSVEWQSHGMEDTGQQEALERGAARVRESRPSWRCSGGRRGRRRCDGRDEKPDRSSVDGGRQPWGSACRPERPRHGDRPTCSASSLAVFVSLLQISAPRLITTQLACSPRTPLVVSNTFRSRCDVHQRSVREGPAAARRMQIADRASHVIVLVRAVAVRSASFHQNMITRHAAPIIFVTLSLLAPFLSARAAEIVAYTDVQCQAGDPVYGGFVSGNCYSQRSEDTAQRADTSVSRLQELTHACLFACCSHRNGHSRQCQGESSIELEY